MTSEPELRPLAQTLLEKTRRGLVNWVEDPSFDDSAYAVKLQKAGIVIRRVEPIADPDYLVLAFTDDKGRAAIALTADEPEPSASVSADWELLLALYTEARRQATGWDVVLSEVRTALSGQGPIGLLPASK